MFGQPAIDDQCREAMDEGPACQGNIVRIKVASEEFRGRHCLLKGGKAGTARFIQVRVPRFLLDRRAEHQFEEARLLSRKENVGDAQRSQPCPRIGRRHCRCGKPGCKLAEAVFGDRRKQRFLSAK